MEGLLQLMEAVRKNGRFAGHFRGLLHVLIGRRISAADGTVISTGQTWREVAVLLKRARWDKSVVEELGIDSAELPPRDRERYWFTAILRAQLDSDQARTEGDLVAKTMTALGYHVGTGPHA